MRPQAASSREVDFDPVRTTREHDFSRDASHELRTPLTVIRVAADLMGRDGGLSTASQRSLARIQDAVSGMEATIDALLLLARGEQCTVETEDFHAREVVEHEIARAEPIARHKQLAIRLDADANPLLHSMPRVLQVMLRNLLANAIRFTDQGGVRVHLLADRVVVEDSGVGMEAAVMARAFEPFYRGDGMASTGTGLGLSITHRLAQRVGWPLELDSAPGRGTRVTIRFAASIRDDAREPALRD